MRTQRFEFDGAEGQRLSAQLDLPDGRPRAYVLFAHCFSCSKKSHAAVRIARALTLMGLGVLRFDLRGWVTARATFPRAASAATCAISSSPTLTWHRGGCSRC